MLMDCLSGAKPYLLHSTCALDVTCNHCAGTMHTRMLQIDFMTEYILQNVYSIIKYNKGLMVMSDSLLFRNITINPSSLEIVISLTIEFWISKTFLKYNNTLTLCITSYN